METQLDFPFPLDEAKLTAFLTQVVAIEDEQDRLREELRVLKVDFEPFFPMRAVLTALKIVRATQKLAEHPQEPMTPVHLSCLRVLVERHMARLKDASAACLAEALAAQGGRLSVDMTTGEVTA